LSAHQQVKHSTDGRLPHAHSHQLLVGLHDLLPSLLAPAMSLRPSSPLKGHTRPFHTSHSEASVGRPGFPAIFSSFTLALKRIRRRGRSVPTRPPCTSCLN